MPAPGPSVVPAQPPPLPLKYYRCPKGHEQVEEQEFSYQLLNRRTGKNDWDSGPLCYRCVFEFLVDNFQTARQAPPAEPEITAEQMAEVVKAAEQGERMPDVEIDGVEHYKCAAEGCTVFISTSGRPGERPPFCPTCQEGGDPSQGPPDLIAPDVADANPPAGS